MHEKAIAQRPMRGALMPPTGKAFLYVFVVLSLCLVGVDVSLYGPLTYSAAAVLVVKPAERDWGFHAEPKQYSASDPADELLTVVRVTSGGAFDRAGIRPGFAFAPRGSATGGSRFGGAYAVFAGHKATARVRMLVRSNGQWQEQTIDITR